MSKLDQIRALRETRKGGRKPSNKPIQRGPGTSAKQPPSPAEGSVRPLEGVPTGSLVGAPSHFPKGRPRVENRERTLKALEPWKAEKMSRATWFRRKSESLGGKND
jgi:hypothetical protein